MSSHRSKELIELAKGNSQKSLATFRPKEIVEFFAEEDTRTWKEQWLANYQQYGLFEIDEKEKGCFVRLSTKFPTSIRIASFAKTSLNRAR